MSLALTRRKPEEVVAEAEVLEAEKDAPFQEEVDHAVIDPEVEVQERQRHAQEAEVKLTDRTDVLTPKTDQGHVITPETEKEHQTDVLNALQQGAQPADLALETGRAIDRVLAPGRGTDRVLETGQGTDRVPVTGRGTDRALETGRGTDRVPDTAPGTDRDYVLQEPGLLFTDLLYTGHRTGDMVNTITTLDGAITSGHQQQQQVSSTSLRCQVIAQAFM